MGTVDNFLQPQLGARIDNNRSGDIGIKGGRRLAVLVFFAEHHENTELFGFFRLEEIPFAIGELQLIVQAVLTWVNESESYLWFRTGFQPKGADIIFFLVIYDISSVFFKPWNAARKGQYFV